MRRFSCAIWLTWLCIDEQSGWVRLPWGGHCMMLLGFMQQDWRIRELDNQINLSQVFRCPSDIFELLLLR
jgi:hypothetical protein